MDKTPKKIPYTKPSIIAEGKNDYNCIHNKPRREGSKMSKNFMVEIALSSGLDPLESSKFIQGYFKGLSSLDDIANRLDSVTYIKKPFITFIQVDYDVEDKNYIENPIIINVNYIVSVSQY